MKGVCRMDAAKVCEILRSRGVDARFAAAVESTQDECIRAGRGGAPSGSLVLASSQVAGRGRMGRRWLSPAGGLYASIMLRPALRQELWSALTLHAGLAVVSAVRAAGVADARLKWPNDCLAGGRKLCGILAESFPGDGIVVIGLGMNIESAPDVGSVECLHHGLPSAFLDGLVDVDHDVFCADLLFRMRSALLRADSGLPLDTRAISEMLWDGGTINACCDGSEFSGRATGVDPLGRLIVLLPDGSVRHVSTGEV